MHIQLTRCGERLGAVWQIEEDCPTMVSRSPRTLSLLSS